MKRYAWYVILSTAGLAGCGKSGSTGPSGGTGGVITVAGRVIGQNGQGAAGIPVFVGGMPSTNTDASGNFSITGVTAPYDITVVDAPNKRALVYRSLSRADPTLVFLSSFPATTWRKRERLIPEA
jgi:hypothetical protein